MRFESQRNVPARMSGTGEQPGPSRAYFNVENAGKWLALFGSLIAAGQAGTAWLRGYWQAEAEKQKSAQELALAQLKDKSDLAQQYLKVILDNNTKPADRAVLLTALGQIDGHPLQKWAQDQYNEYQKNLSRLFDAYKAENDAAQQRESAQQRAASLSAEVDALSSQQNMVRDDPEKRDALQKLLTAKYSELGQVRATLAVAAVRVDETKDVITRSEQGLPVPGSSNAAETITTLSSKITVSLLKGVFPEKARSNIEANAPYLQAALQEFQVSDPKMAAAIVATIAVETPNFEAYEESTESAKHWENRADLGNTQPGDGVLFRGRGYLGLTGRANYERMSVSLGLGRRLLDSPDDAKNPEIASRILVAWLVDPNRRISQYLTSNDLASVRRVVAGSPTQLDRFAGVYNKVLAQL